MEGEKKNRARLWRAYLVAALVFSMAAEVASHGPVAVPAVHAAQRTLVEALCRLCRGSQVAFDDPADMVA